MQALWRPNRLRYYKQHFACFQCRKMVRKPAEEDLADPLRSDYHPFCPDCGKPLYLMGKSFAPPKQRQVKEWKAIEKKHEQWVRRVASSTYMARLKAATKA